MQATQATQQLPRLEAGLAALRDGMKTIMAASLEGIAKAAGGDVADFAARAVQLERAAYNSSVRAARAAPKTPHRQFYVNTARAVIAELETQRGPYPDDILGLAYLRGSMAGEAVVAESLSPVPPPDPRETMRRMFVRTLMAAHPGYAADRERALDHAREIEVSCYNAAVRASKESEDPPRRQWDSPAFVDIYGTRCGTINGLLDPDSSACRAYGATLAPRLHGGAIAPGALGDLTAKELCPEATAAERAEIAKRVVQKVQMKESTLFRCPHCNERRCTYREVQRRSLDEAPDYLCLCISCGRRFTGRS
jgi:hypothetical protein